jgi:hypothetical protein
LDVGKGAKISGPGTKTYIVQTVDVETGLVSNCPTDATDFTVKSWDEDYIEAKVAVFPAGGANSGDLDAYNSGQLDGENKQVASDSDEMTLNLLAASLAARVAARGRGSFLRSFPPRRQGGVYECATRSCATDAPTTLPTHTSYTYDY